MKVQAATVEEYLQNIQDVHIEGINKLLEVIRKNIPEGFKETICYGMIGFVVPYSIYPKGYHCDPKVPLPFVNVASQKNFISFYHMGIYGSTNLLDWFLEEYGKISTKKLDMGKSCMRFKKSEDIPYELIGKLMQKITVEQWISYCDENWSKTKSK